MMPLDEQRKQQLRERFEEALDAADEVTGEAMWDCFRAVVETEMSEMGNEFLQRFLGLTHYQVRDTHTIDFIAKPWMCSYRGIVYGGLLAWVADLCAGRNLNELGLEAVTTDLEYAFSKKIHPGEAVRAWCHYVPGPSTREREVSVQGTVGTGHSGGPKTFSEGVLNGYFGTIWHVTGENTRPRYRFA